MPVHHVHPLLVKVGATVWANFRMSIKSALEHADISHTLLNVQGVVTQRCMSWAVCISCHLVHSGLYSTCTPSLPGFMCHWPVSRRRYHVWPPSPAFATYPPTHPDPLCSTVAPPRSSCCTSTQASQPWPAQPLCCYPDAPPAGPCVVTMPSPPTVLMTHDII